MQTSRTGKYPKWNKLLNVQYQTISHYESLLYNCAIGCRLKVSERQMRAEHNNIFVVLAAESPCVISDHHWPHANTVLFPHLTDTSHLLSPCVTGHHHWPHRNTILIPHLADRYLYTSCHLASSVITTDPRHNPLHLAEMTLQTFHLLFKYNMVDDVIIQNWNFQIFV